MSQKLALEQIERFLATKDPEVLSVSGRWGVGKTHLWDETLKAKRESTPLRRYAYVSIFGLRSLDALRTAIVQSTIPLDGPDLEPTVDSFVEHLSSFSGLKRLSEQAGRKSMSVFSKGAAAVPYVGKLADLLAPGAALLIRDQIICIDDIERAGQGLDVADVLGLVSSLRERRRCKVVLLLNEDGLGEQGTKYRAYLEKVVDQAVKFEPTPEESAVAAIAAEDALGQRLVKQTVALGIKNIRVIRRIRRFLEHLEPELTGLHIGVTDQVTHSIALLGWCVFEPTLAPDLERVRRHARFSDLFSEEERATGELETDQLLKSYGYGNFDQIDQILLAGLQAGALDRQALRKLFEEADSKLAEQDAQKVIAKPWSIFRDGLDDNQGEFLDALSAAIEQHGDAMSAADASDALRILRELGRAEEADRLLPVYVGAQQGKPREFFAAHIRDQGRLDPQIAAAFDTMLAEMPLDRDPAEILLEITRSRSWSLEKLAYLATVPPEGYDKMLKDLRGEDLHSAIVMALDFSRMQPVGTNECEIARRMAAALQRAAAESDLNRLRLLSYLRSLPHASASGEQIANDVTAPPSPAAP